MRSWSISTYCGKLFPHSFLFHSLTSWPMGSFAGGLSRAIAQKSPLNASSTSAHGKYWLFAIPSLTLVTHCQPRINGRTIFRLRDLVFFYTQLSSRPPLLSVTTLLACLEKNSILPQLTFHKTMVLRSLVTMPCGIQQKAVRTLARLREWNFLSLPRFLISLRQHDVPRRDSLKMI